MKKSHEEHGKKMCALTCCPCNVDLDKIIPLVNNSKYICEACGRTANNAENLFRPVELS